MLHVLFSMISFIVKIWSYTVLFHLNVHWFPSAVLLTSFKILIVCFFHFTEKENPCVITTHVLGSFFTSFVWILLLYIEVNDLHLYFLPFSPKFIQHSLFAKQLNVYFLFLYFCFFFFLTECLTSPYCLFPFGIIYICATPNRSY